MPIYQLPNEPLFPHPDDAEPDGLLAIGGDLSVRRLVAAYASGIFPWFNEGDPILWWSPDPRLVLFTDKFKVSKSLQQKINRRVFDIRIDFAFDEVIEFCSQAKRRDQHGTWITDEVQKAYKQLFRLGIAHSVETWEGNKLVGGLYGLSLGSAFFGESMFHKRSDASKVAFYYLNEICKKWNFKIIDCQVTTNHLLSMGAEEISRSEFLDLLNLALLDETRKGNWEKMVSLL